MFRIRNGSCDALSRVLNRVFSEIEIITLYDRVQCTIVHADCREDAIFRFVLTSCDQ